MQHRLYGLRGRAYVQKYQEIFNSERDEILKAFNEIIANNDGKFTPLCLGKLANQFCLPVSVMDKYLSSLKLIPVGTWERLRDRGCKAKDIGVEWN